MERIEIEEKEIELRSEEFQEVLGSVPGLILRRGITLLACIVVMLIVGSWLFKYPEIISTSMVLTTTTPPAGIVSKIGGKIAVLVVKDQELVTAGECLAILENPARYEDIIFLKSELSKVLISVKIEKVYNLSYKELKLGALQSSYSSFLINLENYNKFIEVNYYPRKITATRGLIEANRAHYISSLNQKITIDKQNEIEIKSFNRTAYLFKQNLISEEESDKAQNTLLQSTMNVQNMHSTLESMQIQISQMEDNLVDIQQQYQEKKNSMLSELKTITNQLENEVHSWEMTYVLTSPITGKITFTSYWAKNQNIIAGDNVFTVIPTIQTQLIGKAQLPIARSGKVKSGQNVNVHFNNYPDNEYGMVIGQVKRISLIPTKDGNYVVEVNFPKGLTTTYGKKLPLSQEMTANADIITDDLRLIEQFLQPVKRIYKNNIATTN